MAVKRKTKSKRGGRTKAKAVTTIAPSSKDETTRVEKIDNGYLVTQTSFSPKGEYKEKKMFTKSKPKIQIT